MFFPNKVAGERNAENNCGNAMMSVRTYFVRFCIDRVEIINESTLTMTDCFAQDSNWQDRISAQNKHSRIDFKGECGAQATALPINPEAALARVAVTLLLPEYKRRFRSFCRLDACKS